MRNSLFIANLFTYLSFVCIHYFCSRFFLVLSVDNDVKITSNVVFFGHIHTNGFSKRYVRNASWSQALRPCTLAFSKRRYDQKWCSIIICTSRCEWRRCLFSKASVFYCPLLSNFVPVFWRYPVRNYFLLILRVARPLGGLCALHPSLNKILDPPLYLLYSTVPPGNNQYINYEFCWWKTRTTTRSLLLTTLWNAGS